MSPLQACGMQLNMMRSFLKDDVTRSTLPEKEINIDDGGLIRSPSSFNSRLNRTALNFREMSNDSTPLPGFVLARLNATAKHMTKGGKAPEKHPEHELQLPQNQILGNNHQSR